MIYSDKINILALIINQLKADITIAENAVKVARDTATHKDCLGSSKYETMGLEASYLAQGQGIRLLELERSLAYFKQLTPQPLDSIQLGSLVVLNDEHDEQQPFLLAADAGGLKIPYQQHTITVITSKAPLGKAMVGKSTGEDFALKIAGKDRYFKVLSII